MNTPLPQSSNNQTPIMTVVNGRPAKVLEHLSSSNGVFVQCRVPGGEDVFVPLSEIIALVEKDLVVKIRMASGRVN